jgi:hypothetical protein
MHKQDCTLCTFFWGDRVNRIREYRTVHLLLVIAYLDEFRVCIPRRDADLRNPRQDTRTGVLNGID